MALALGFGAWLIRRQVPAITWAEGAEELVVRRGRMFRTLVSVPYGRLQFVDVQSGPLERRFDMATVELHTASPQSGGQIPGLPTAEAEALRERLAARGRVAAGGSVSTEPTPTVPERRTPAEPSRPRRPGAGEWRHLHPLSPLLKGGIAFVAVLAYVVSQQADSFFGAERDDPTQGHLGWAALGVVVVLLAIIAGAWVSWRFSRFRVAATPHRAADRGAVPPAPAGAASTGSRPSTSGGRCWPASPGCPRWWSSRPAARTPTSSCPSSPTPRPSRCASS